MFYANEGRKINGTRILDLVLVKPLTYMNLSGTAVRKVLARERAPLTDLLVVTDDFALPFGKMRFRESGSAGGHNGLTSIIEEMDTEKFNRLRVGIGDPARGAVDHVLGRFDVTEQARLDELLDAAADAQGEWAKHPPRERAEILRRAYEAIMDQADDLAYLIWILHDVVAIDRGRAARGHREGREHTYERGLARTIGA